MTQAETVRKVSGEREFLTEVLFLAARPFTHRRSRDTEENT